MDDLYEDAAAAAGTKAAAAVTKADAPEKKKKAKKRAAEGDDDERVLKFRKLSQLEHVKLRPGMYVGSTAPAPSTRTLITLGAEGAVEARRATVEFVPALLKLFDEVVTNALDAATKDPTVTNISVSLGDDFMSVRNNGAGMPVGVHPEHGIPLVEMVFGHLNTGTNFDESEERTVAGLHGLGIKLCNIFSSEFTVSVRDGATGSTHEQTWHDQMSRAAEPKSKVRDKPVAGFVDVLFRPIPALLAPAGRLTDDVRGVLAARVLDVALAVRDGVKVKLNDVALPASSLKKYAKLLCPDGFLAVDESDGDGVWRVAVAAAGPEGADVHALVNGVSAPAGKHVEHVESRLYAAVIEKAANKRGAKGVTVKAAALRARVRLFVVAKVADPQFDSQTKERCVTCKLLKKYEPSDAFVAKIAASEIVEAATQEERARQVCGAARRGARRPPHTSPTLRPAAAGPRRTVSWRPRRTGARRRT